MDWLLGVLWLILWIFLWYRVFYFQYKNRFLIDEMRTHLKNSRKENEAMKADCIEFSQQNKLLKWKVAELLDKNNDLSKIVSELSRYYYHMKVASEKASELVKLLHLPDEQIDWKIQKHANLSQNSIVNVQNKNVATKKFF